MKTLAYLNDQLELLKEIQSRRLSTAVKEDIERVQECIEEVKELQEKLTYLSIDAYFECIENKRNTKCQE